MFAFVQDKKHHDPTQGTGSTYSRPHASMKPSLPFLTAVPALLLGLLLGIGAGPADAASSPAPAPAATAASGTCPTLLDHRFDDLQTGKPVDLCQYRGKVVIVVNTASFCGFAPQLGQLETLYRKYGRDGLVVLGFPSDDFHQEFDNPLRIVPYSRKHYQVSFPLFNVSHVTEPHPNPLYEQLILARGVQPKWNFYKYLIGRDGKFVAEYSSLTSPDSREFRTRVLQLLRATP